MKWKIRYVVLGGILLFIHFYGFAQIQPKNITVKKIWSNEYYNAFTSLLKFNGEFYCSFRRGSAHVDGKSGIVKIIRSKDGENWEPVATLVKPGYDLRDPKLSVTPDGKIMVIMGGSVYEGRKRLSMLSQVSFSNQTGTHFSEPQSIEVEQENRTENDWMWRVTWHENVGYAILQRVNPRTSLLFKTSDGIHYNLIIDFSDKISEGPGESTIRFLPGGEAFMMVRRTGKGLWGKSYPPYINWTWTDTGMQFGGPDFVQLDENYFLAGTRVVGESNYTGLFLVDKAGKFTEILKLPSGGDTGYPGIVIDSGNIYVSYYSSHEGNAAIYLATIPLTEILLLGKK